MDSIGSWYGTPIETLGRDELIRVIKYLSKQLEKERKEHDRDLDLICCIKGGE